MRPLGEALCERMEGEPFPPQVDEYQPVTQHSMTYMQTLEARLERLLSGIPEKEIIIREVKAIALERYRNGQKAGAPKTGKRETAKTAPAKHYKR